MNKVVISGLGIVGPHGVGTDSFVKGDSQAANWFSPWPKDVELPRPGATIAQVGAIPSQRFFTDRQMRMMDRAMQLSSVAAGLAIEDAGLDAQAQKEACTFLGTARAELPSCYNFIRPQLGEKREQLNAADFPKIARNVACGQVAIRYGMQGPSTVLASGALASMEAIVRATQYIRQGRARVALVGGYEALSRFALYFFAHHYQQQLQGEHPQFFGQDEGFVVPSEGACTLILESEESAKARGAQIYCDIDRWHCGRLGNDQDADWALQESWLHVCQDQPVGLFSAAAGGGSRPHEKTETKALRAWLSPTTSTQVIAPRAWIGEGEAWASALQVAIAAAALRANHVSGTADSIAFASSMTAYTQGGALKHRSALVSGFGENNHYSHLFLSRR